MTDGTGKTDRTDRTGAGMGYIAIHILDPHAQTVQNMYGKGG